MEDDEQVVLSIRVDAENFKKKVRRAKRRIMRWRIEAWLRALFRH
jgi:hypothetical protein